MSSISAHLLTYRDWYNKQVSESYIAPKCDCGGVMLWSVNKCHVCAEDEDLQYETVILEWHLYNDKEYKKSTTSN